MTHIKQDLNQADKYTDNKGWENIYKELGIVQREIMPCVKRFIDLLLHEKKKTLVLLDAGCGTGRHTIFMAENLLSQRSIHIESFDISQEAIEIVNEVIKKTGILKNCNVSMRTFINDLDKGLPYQDEYFDGIVSTLVVEHGRMKQIRKWIEDIRRVLRKGSLLAFSVPSVDDPRYQTGDELEPGTKINIKQKDGFLPHHFFTDQEVENLFSRFEVVYKDLHSRPSVTADVLAKHWEYVFRKR